MSRKGLVIVVGKQRGTLDAPVSRYIISHYHFGDGTIPCKRSVE